MIANPRMFTFVGGCEGQWQVNTFRVITGEGLAAVKSLSVVPGNLALTDAKADWLLRGVTSNERYVTRPEKIELLAKQPAIGRPEANCAVLIPIRKNAAWWTLTQGERRQIFEEQSHHTQIGLDYLPAVARRLHHCRDLSSPEPFDFLTWFEFAEKDSPAFDRLIEQLRATVEWQYIDREVEIRLSRVHP